MRGHFSDTVTSVVKTEVQATETPLQKSEQIKNTPKLRGCKIHTADPCARTFPLITHQRHSFLRCRFVTILRLLVA